MERKVSPSLNDQKPNTKSSFISQNSPESKEKVSLQLNSRKQLSSSTFLDLEDSKQKAQPDRKIAKEGQYPLAQELTRARSLKNIEEGKFKSMKLLECSQLDSLNSLSENTLKLKAEELLFKLKVRLGTLLQEVSVPEAEVARFNKLAKVDEIILFLSEKVKERVAQLASQRTETPVSSTEKNHPQVQALRGKLAEKQANEKTYRSRLKESNGELKALYQKVNTKEKEYSQKVTEIYQLKTQLKETEKLIEAQKHKLIAFEKERAEMKSLMSSDSKDQGDLIAGFEHEKAELQLQLQETKQELEKYRQKDAKLQQLNLQLSEELTRWRQRFQFQGERRQSSEKEKSSQGSPLTPNDLIVATPNQLKKSTMSMSSAYINNFNTSTRVLSLTSLEIENAKLRLQLKELQKQNEQLQRDLLNYSTFKEKYEDTLSLVGEKEVDLNNGIDNKKLDYLKERSAELFRKEIENHYKRKTEQVARQWKEKLYEIVCKYEDEMELLKTEIADLARGQQLAEKKIYTLANEKYELETSLLALEKQIHSRTRIPCSKHLVILPNNTDNLTNDKQEEQDLNASASHLQLRPIAEEDSPLKSKKQSSTEEPSLLNELGRSV